MEERKSLVWKVRCLSLNVWNAVNLSVQELDDILCSPAQILSEGGLIAFPTETVYGLGANAFDEQAVQHIFRAKGRPSDNPLIVHIARVEDVAKVCAEGFSPNPGMQKAMSAFWPGPLTIIVPAGRNIAKSVHPNMDTVGVRMPAHSVARRLIALSGCPIAAPSANKSGRPSPTTAQDVVDDLDGEIDGIVDGGSCNVGLESTVVSIHETEAVIYRPGGITKEQLESVLGIPVLLDPHLTSQNPTDIAPKSPGMKYRHYAPDASVYVWYGNRLSVQKEMHAFFNTLSLKEQSTAAIMGPSDLIHGFAISDKQVWTTDVSDEYASSLSQALYHQLRLFDQIGMTKILICGVHPDDGMGMALMNRLYKASEGRVYSV